MANIPLPNGNGTPLAPKGAPRGPLPMVPAVRYNTLQAPQALPVMDTSSWARAAMRASQQPTMPLDMFRGQQVAGEAWGKAAQEIGGVVMDITMKAAAAKNYADLHDAKAAMQASVADYEKWKITNPDSTKWENELQRRFQGVQEHLAKQGYSPIVRRQVDREFETFKTHGVINAGIDAAKVQFTRAAAANRASRDMAVEQRDLAALDAANAEGVRLGIITDKEGALDRLRGRNAMQAEDRDDVISAAPVMAKQMLMGEIEPAPEFADLSPAQRMASLQKVDIMLSRNRRAILEKVENDVLTGVITSPQDFESRLAEYNLGESMDPATKAQALQMIRGSKVDLSEFNKMLTETKAFDSSMKDAAAYEAGLRTRFMQFPPAYREQLDKALDERVNGSKSDTSALRFLRTVIDDMHNREQMTDEKGSPITYKQDKYLFEALADHEATKAFGLTSSQTDELRKLEGPARFQRFREMLQARVKGGNPEVKDMEAYNKLSKFKKDLFNQALHAGVFVNPETHDASALRAAQLKRELEAWFEKNPDATEDEAMSWLSQQTRRDVRSSALMRVRPSFKNAEVVTPWPAVPDRPGVPTMPVTPTGIDPTLLPSLRDQFGH